ncbi:hypothetical protein COL154_004236 [Colletotrichum chrysophilum]|nr:hypothetical protein COL154_004236 [Colletotrichum chrysophilum]
MLRPGRRGTGKFYLQGSCWVAESPTPQFGDGAPEIIRQHERDHIHQVATETIVQGVPTDQIFTGSEQDDPAAAAEQQPLEKHVPRMPYYRNNLTALSQRYNVGVTIADELYFAAYENRIFVYRPKSALRHALPREPNLILATKPDKVAIHVGGTLDPRFHHQTNHITTGFLGREEVLVAAYDDGSVIAWYVGSIADYVDSRTAAVPTPFFRDNVGRSAWGIVVHQQSRLIAVSSNRFEVTVFAFALSRLPEALWRRDRPYSHCEACVFKRKRNWRIVIPLGDGGHNIPNISIWDDEDGFAEKVVAIDINGTLWILDIWKPKTKAIQIQHRTHVTHHWNFRHQMGWGVAVLPYESFLPAYSSAELLGLEEGDIMNSKPPLAGRWVETQKSLANVRNHPSPLSAQAVPEPEPNEIFALAPMGFEVPPLDGGAWIDDELAGNPPGGNGPALTIDVDDSDDEEEEEDSDSDGSAPLNMQPPAETLSSDSSDTDGSAPLHEDEIEDDSDSDGSAALPNFLEAQDWFMQLPVNYLPEQDPPLTHAYPIDAALGALEKNKDQPGWHTRIESEIEQFRDMVYLPHEGKAFSWPDSLTGRVRFHKRERVRNRNTVDQDPDVLDELASRSCIMRTYEYDIELRSINMDDGAAVVCRDPINFDPAQNMFMQHAERLNMIIHVPELSLVVVGSAIGRVVLLTPTRTAYPHGLRREGFKVKNGFRIDWVLPTRADEEAGKRPNRSLYGIAVGPVQEAGAPGCLLRADGAAAPSPATRRYRLMLHYRDHRILSYDIGRDEKGEHLLVF